MKVPRLVLSKDLLEPNLYIYGMHSLPVKLNFPKSCSIMCLIDISLYYGHYIWDGLKMCHVNHWVY